MSNLGALLTGVGLERPGPQQSPGAGVCLIPVCQSFRSRNLLAHDGDVLFLMDGGRYSAESVVDSSLYPRLRAVRRKQVFLVSGELWDGFGPLTALWVLDDVRRTLMDGGDPLRGSEAAERLRTLVAATA